MQFSIIIPAKNEHDNIGRCLDSIGQVNWDKDCYEIIVVDNGSLDDTVAIARQKGATVHVKPDLTIAALRNFGASTSTGDILAFLDADCTVDMEWLAAASRYFECDDVVAFGSPAVVPEGGTWVQLAWFNVRGRPGKVIGVDWLESANLFVKRSAFFAVNGFDEALVTCEDYFLTQKLRSLGKLVSDCKVAAVHYREPATIMEFIKKEMWRGRSNYTGLFKRKIPLHEMPSLVLPLLQMLFVVILVISVVLSLMTFSRGYSLLLPCLLLIWQIPISVVAYRKNETGKFLTVVQLLVLLNCYFIARGLVVFHRCDSVR